MLLSCSLPQVNAHARRGETVVVSGDVSALGSFAPSQSIALHTNPEIYPLWQTSPPVVVPFGVQIRYKYASELTEAAAALPPATRLKRKLFSSPVQSSLEAQSDNGSHELEIESSTAGSPTWKSLIPGAPARSLPLLPLPACRLEAPARKPAHTPTPRSALPFSLLMQP